MIISTWPFRASVIKASAVFTWVGLLSGAATPGALGNDLLMVPGLNVKLRGTFAVSVKIVCIQRFSQPGL